MIHRSRQDDLYAAGYHEGLRAAKGPLASLQPAPPPPVPVPPAADCETFAQLLARFRERCHLSCNRLAHEAGMDLSYLHRIETEQRPPPLRHLVDALARVLFLTPFEYRQFVTAAGYSPVQVWTPELEATHRARKVQPS